MKTLTVVMSEACNLNCSYCDLDKQTDKKIDPDLCINQIRSIRASDPDEIIKLDFFGGEPLMQLPIINKILAEFKDEPNMKFFMPTNGLLLNERVLAYLKEHNVDISISFDGLWQDINRKQLTGRQTSDKLLKKKDLFKGLKCHTMVTHGNYNLLENHLYIKDTIGLIPEMTLVRDTHTWDGESVKLLQDGITELFDWYIANPAEDMPFFILFYLRHMLLYEGKGVSINNCGAGDSLITFSENRMMPCYRIATDSELTVDAMEKLIPIYQEMPECSVCEVKNYCRKGCMLENMKNGGPIGELCDIYRYTYKEVSRMINALNGDRAFQQLIMKELEDE